MGRRSGHSGKWETSTKIWTYKPHASELEIQPYAKEFPNVCFPPLWSPCINTKYSSFALYKWADAMRNRIQLAIGENISATLTVDGTCEMWQDGIRGRRGSMQWSIGMGPGSDREVRRSNTKQFGLNTVHSDAYQLDSSHTPSLERA